MFYGCQSLKELNVTNFKTNFVRDLSGMFLWCKALKFINISNFVFNDLANINLMFFGCSKELQIKVKQQNKVLSLNKKAFES
jgi:surface protein